jgi:CO/xanthine dehydrogenase FAD-binding subunit
VKACIGSAGPTPIRAHEAERFAAGALDWESRAPLGPAAAAEFGALVERAAQPIDDVRGTAAYRHHALGVLARRALRWTWDEYREESA